jgi:hypothetical protein
VGATLSSLLYAVVATFLRLAMIPVLGLTPLEHRTPTWHDPAFSRVWFLGLSWAAAESVVAVYKGYKTLNLYKDVLVPKGTVLPPPPPPVPETAYPMGYGIGTGLGYGYQLPLQLETGRAGSRAPTDPSSPTVKSRSQSRSQPSTPMDLTASWSTTYSNGPGPGHGGHGNRMGSSTNLLPLTTSFYGSTGGGGTLSASAIGDRDREDDDVRTPTPGQYMRINHDGPPTANTSHYNFPTPNLHTNLSLPNGASRLGGGEAEPLLIHPPGPNDPLLPVGPGPGPDAEDKYLQSQLDRDLEELDVVKRREEVEELYGMAYIVSSTPLLFAVERSFFFVPCYLYTIVFTMGPCCMRSVPPKPPCFSCFSLKS